MSSIRIRFTRGSSVKFISHLDLMKVFERSLRRTGLPVAYSQGFNPHPQMVFGLPLSVGVTSAAEYADFELEGDTRPGEFMDRMNGELPPGIRVLEAAEKQTRENIMAVIAAAVYEISLFLESPSDIGTVREEISRFLKLDKILAKKEGKGGSREIDIRPMILDLSVHELEEIPEGYGQAGPAYLMTARLKAGSVSNLRPDLLVSALGEMTGLVITSALLHRSRMFVDKGGQLADPMDEGVVKICQTR